MSKRTRLKVNRAKHQGSAGRYLLVLAVIVAAAAWRWNAGRPAQSKQAPETNRASLTATNPDIDLAPTTPVGLTNDPSTLVDQGTALFYKGDMEGAAGKYSQALKLNPEDEEIHFNMARACTVLGRTNEAILHYMEALRILPEYAEAHNNLGNLLVALRRHPEALEHFSAALKANPENSSALNNLGRCLAEMGQTKEAAVQFSEAVRLHPDYLEAHFNLASAQASLGNFEEAIRELEKVLQLEPDFVPAKEALQRVRAKQAKKTP